MNTTDRDIDYCIREYFSQATFRAIVKQEAQQVIARYTGIQFTPFKYIPQNEMTLSWIIADLLNPNGEHGQKDTFLQIFTEKVLQDATLDCSTVAVRIEATTRNITRKSRRIDILLTAPDWACAIENKPRASQQPDQLEDYAQHLATLRKAKTFMVFLAPHWITPQTVLTKEDGLRLWHFTKDKSADQTALGIFSEAPFQAWLEECRQHCEADTVRRFIADFQHWVDAFW